jgi:hypothetical protein
MSTSFSRNVLDRRVGRLSERQRVSAITCPAAEITTRQERSSDSKSPALPETTAGSMEPRAQAAARLKA